MPRHQRYMSGPLVAGGGIKGVSLEEVVRTLHTKLDLARR